MSPTAAPEALIPRYEAWADEVREVVSRNLGRFRAQGLIKIQDRQVEIVNRAGLQQEAESQA